MAQNPKIIMRPIDSIRPYENNPRHNKNAIRDVATSIRKYGWKQPIVVDKEGVIVVGHTRYLAAQQLGLTEVPVLVSDLTDKQNREYRIADNKTNELASWDFDKLAEEIADLDFGEFDFDLSFVMTDAEDSGDGEAGGGRDRRDSEAEAKEGVTEYGENEFGDEQFQCQCPRCGFRFNPKASVPMEVEPDQAE